MKKYPNLKQFKAYFSALLLAGIMGIQACSDDDEKPVPTPEPEGLVRIVAVDAITDKITFKNVGPGSIDISEMWICNLITYAQIKDLTTNVELDPNESVEFDRILNDNASDVGLYTANTFTDADAMIDFMQYGEDVGTNGRADVAVTKGIWTAGEFVSKGSPYSFTGTATNFGASFWQGTGVANVRISKVDAVTNEVVLTNFGEASMDISGFWICNEKKYAVISSLTSEDLTLDPDETITLTRDGADELNDASSDVGLYSNNSGFNSTDNMVDFMQYGKDIATNGRADVAVTKGIWTAGQFVDGISAYNYTGDGSQNGASAWEGTTPTPIIRISSVNSTADEIVIKNFGNAPLDISGYFICNRFSYAAITTLTSEDLTLDPDEEVTLSRTLDDTSSDVGLYLNASGYGNAANILDFMQYGEDLGAGGRAGVAVTKGIWTTGEFVSGGTPYSYTGDGSQNGASNWMGN